jgi:hypothetical protein
MRYARRVSAWRRAAIAAAAIAIAPSEADACSRLVAVPTLAEPIFDADAVAVVATTIEIVCRDAGGRVHCSFDVHYRVRNASQMAVTTRAVIGSSHLAPVVAPGLAVERTKERILFDVDDGARARDAWAFSLSLAADETRELAVHAEASMPIIYPTFDSGCSREGIRSRHPIAVRGDSGGIAPLAYWVHPAHRPTDVEEAPLEVHVVRPPEWAVAILQSTSDALARALDDDRAHFRAERGEVRVELQVRPSLLWNGGPFVGAGWAFAPNAGTRLRIGYEVAAPYWLVHSVAVESDVSRTLSVVPAIEAITQSSLVLGAGVGVPIVVTPRTHAGGRLQVSGSISAIGLRGAVDVYQDGVEGAIFGQVSF